MHAPPSWTFKKSLHPAILKLPAYTGSIAPTCSLCPCSPASTSPLFLMFLCSCFNTWSVKLSWMLYIPPLPSYFRNMFWISLWPLHGSSAKRWLGHTRLVGLANICTPSFRHSLWKDWCNDSGSCLFFTCFWSASFLKNIVHGSNLWSLVWETPSQPFLC